MKVISLNSLSHHELVSSKTGEIYSKSAVLTDFFGFQDIFVRHEILQPGQKSSALHHHTLREEMVIVLNGFPICHFGDQKITMKPGDVIGFKPSSEESHYIENTTNDEVVHMLVICSNPKDDLTVYD